MDFWSKGLGNRTVSLRLGNGDAVKSGDKLYVKGQTEEPIVWDYIMPVRSTDLVEFVDLLRDEHLVEYLYRSPHRWRLYWTLLVGGLRFVGLLAKYMVVDRHRPAPEEPTIQVPPPSDRRRRRLEGHRTPAQRIRLGDSRVAGTTAKPAD